MKGDHRSRDLVLGIHPTTTGFGWVISDAPRSPVEWGNASLSKDRNARSLKRIQELIQRFHPSEIVLEQFEGKPSRRHVRIRQLYRSIVKLAQKNGIEARILTREAVEAAFVEFNAKTRYEIARVIANKIDTFAHLLPPKRKPWLPEHPRMGLFNAAALAITFFALIDGKAFDQ